MAITGDLIHICDSVHYGRDVAKLVCIITIIYDWPSLQNTSRNISEICMIYDQDAAQIPAIEKHWSMNLRD